MMKEKAKERKIINYIQEQSDKRDALHNYVESLDKLLKIEKRKFNNAKNFSYIKEMKKRLKANSLEMYNSFQETPKYI